MEPAGAEFTAEVVDSPTQSSRKIWLLLGNFSSRMEETGRREYLGLACPSGRPRWDIRMTDLAPEARVNYLYYDTEVVSRDERTDRCRAHT